MSHAHKKSEVVSRAAASPPAPARANGPRAADSPPAAARETGADMLGGGNLEQVREILFGAQSRNADRRLARLEEDLPKRVAEIREELKRGVAALEAYARHEIDSLNERLRVENRERSKADEEQSARLDETARAVRAEVAELRDGSATAQRELRQQILDQSKRLDDDIQRRADELSAALLRAVEELRHEKADRKAVAGILHEVAMRLADELSLPLADGTNP
jgi:DNA anti-recombination protein RmuC